MPTGLSDRWRTFTGWTALLLGGLFLAILGYGFLEQPDQQPLTARLLPAHMRGEIPWKTIQEEDIIRGASVPPHTHVIFHIPAEGSHWGNTARITRETLFGRRGEQLRYWGYCFPPVGESGHDVGLPGTIFLSEREQIFVRSMEEEMRLNSVESQRNLTEEDLNQSGGIRGIIRHQKEVFLAGETCYVMTEEPLPIGLDPDKDGLNNKLEQQYATNPYNSDTDEDGILDGTEVFGIGTNPLLRDTDGDGLLDGIEDRNRNGRVDPGETSPLLLDTDRDGLCDGFCVETHNFVTQFSAPIDFMPDYNIFKKISFEDINLNGIVDEGETDPLKKDTDSNGVEDGHEFYMCYILEENKDYCANKRTDLFFSGTGATFLSDTETTSSSD